MAHMDSLLTVHHLVLPKAIHSLPILNSHMVHLLVLRRRKANIHLNKATVTLPRSTAHTVLPLHNHPPGTMRPPLSLQQATTLPPHNLPMANLRISRHPTANRRKDMPLQFSRPPAVPATAHPQELCLLTEPPLHHH